MHLSDKILAFRYSVLTPVYDASLPDIAVRMDESNMHTAVSANQSSHEASALHLLHQSRSSAYAYAGYICQCFIISALLGTAVLHC